MGHLFMYFDSLGSAVSFKCIMASDWFLLGLMFYDCF